jgi:hypothetical protein
MTQSQTWERAKDNIERAVVELELFSIHDTQLDVGKPIPPYFDRGPSEHRVGQVDADEPRLPPELMSGFKEDRARAGGDVEDPASDVASASSRSL